jgi:hypothetical protein
MKQFLKGTAAVLLLFMVAFTITGCEDFFDNRKPGDETPQDGETPNDGETPQDGGGIKLQRLRYETVPVKNEETNENYRLVDAVYDSNYDYYTFYLGNVNFTPLVSGAAIYYNGITPLSITYTKETGLEESVTNSMTTAVEESVMSHREINFDVTVTIGSKSPVHSASVAARVGGVFSWENTTTHSVSNTYETAQSVMQGESFSISATIGEHNEPEGKYRYTLFATTDVYYIVVLNKTSPRTVLESYTAVCAREPPAWGIDYISNEISSYIKTAETPLLELPDEEYIISLPEPTEEIDDPPKVPDPEPELVTVWTERRANPTALVNDDRDFNEYFVSNLDLSRLLNEGYTKFTVNIDFWVQEVEDCWVNVYVRGKNGTLVGSTVETIDIGGAWVEQHLGFDMSMSNFDNVLAVEWDASGKNDDEYRLGDRTVTVTAKK